MIGFLNALPPRMSKRRSRLVTASTLLGALMMSIAGDTSKAYEVDNPFNHFIFDPAPGDDTPVLSWSTEPTSFQRGGDQSAYLSGQIDDFVATLARASGLTFTRGAGAKMVLLYDRAIFDDLMNGTSKLKQIGITDDIIAKLQAAYRKQPGIHCLSQLEIDANHNISGAMILSDGPSSECVKPPLYNVFGLQKIDADVDGLIYSCILYHARTTGLRTPAEIKPHLRELGEECIPTLRETERAQGGK